MAIYQPVHVKIWSDSWFVDLTPSAKLLFFYLLTSPSNTPSGMYECPVRRMAFETGLSAKRVVAALESLGGHVMFDASICLVWVVNATKYWPKNPNVLRAIHKDLEERDGHPFVSEYRNRYKTVVEPLADPLPTTDRVNESKREREEGVSNDLRSTSRLRAKKV